MGMVSLVDEKELLMRILEILTRHFDNISAVEASVKSAIMSVYATLFQHWLFYVLDFKFQSFIKINSKSK